MLTKTRKASVCACSIMLAATFAAGIAYATSNQTANAAVQQDEEYPKAEITSYAPYMQVGEEISFTAAYTYLGKLQEDDEEVREIYDYDFTWAVTEGESVTVTENGVVTAVAVGESTLTATYVPDANYNASVTVDVLAAKDIAVSSLYLNASNLSLDIGGEYDLNAVAVPFNATAKTVTWASGDEEIVTVDADGKVTAVNAGTTTITASIALTEEATISAKCEVEVRELDNSILDKTALTLYIGENLGEGYLSREDITATVPGANDETTYEWSSSNDSVATSDPGTAEHPEDNIGSISAWNFGSTIITLTATIPAGEEGGEPTVYVASANVLVTANYFYGIGFEGQWLEETTAQVAKAGGLFTEVEPGIYQLTRNINAYDGFQIIHGGINVNWTTMLNPYWYDAEKSTDDYVDNTTDMFRVTADGVYTIVIDLTGSAAKVSITMLSVRPTAFRMYVAEGYNPYLRDLLEETYIDIYPVPENAFYNAADLVVSTSNEDLVSADYDGEHTIILTLFDEVTAVTNITVNATLAVNGETIATGEYAIAVIPAEFEAPDEVRFDAENYTKDLNNGGAPWTTSVSAKGYKDGAENVITDVIYSVVGDTEDRIYVDPATGDVDIYGLGTFTIRATSVVDSTAYADTTLTVYSSGFYMIGILQGTRVNDWNLIPQDQTTFEGTDFVDWEIPAVGESLTQYQADFTLDQWDRFSIAFLGMAGDWYASINTTYFDAAGSSASYFMIDGTDVVITARAVYTVTLDLSGIKPSFTLIYKEPAEGFTPHNQYLYLEKSGNAWDGSATDEGNIYTTAGYVYVDGENTTSLTFSFTFTSENTVWPTFQFVTANGITGGSFYDSYWYGSGAADEISVDVSGDAIRTTSTSGYFYNGGAGYEYFYVGDAIPEDGITLNFTVNFNELGLITSIVINFGAIAG